MNPVVHFEMPATDRQRVADFYSKVFNWKMNMMGEEMGNYILAVTCDVDETTRRPKQPGMINGGFYPKSANTSNVPSVVIAVEDIHASMNAITGAGGQVHGEPIDIPGVGAFVSFTDTEGNKVSILQPMGM